MKKYVIIWTQMMKISIQRMVEYRTDFVLWSAISLFWTLFALLFYDIVFLQTPTIAGWSKPQVYLLIGVYMIVDSATWGIFWRSIKTYVDSIFDGKLDFVLVQPIDSQFQLSVKYASFTQVPRLCIGIFLALKYLPPINLFQFVMFLILMVIVLLIIYLLWFLTATITFWVEKLENITEIVPSLRRIWNFPSDVYSGPLGTLLTVILPLALISTTPTRFLLHDYAWNEVITLVVFATILFVITRFFFLYSLKKYSSVGS